MNLTLKPAFYSQPKLLVLMAVNLSVAIFAMLELLYVTPQGIGMEGDSFYYVSAADSLMAGKGYASDFSGDLSRLTQWPPLFSVALASIGKVIGDPYMAARWVNTACFGISAWLIGWLIIRFIGWYPRASVFCSLFFALHWKFLYTHAVAMSEPLFLTLSLCALGAILAYFEKPTLRHLVLSAGLFSLAALTRTFGLSFILAVALAIVLWDAGSPIKRIMRAMAFGSMAILPYSGFLIRNLMLEGRFSNQSARPAYFAGSATLLSMLDCIFDAIWPSEFSFRALTRLLLYSAWFGLLLLLAHQASHVTWSRKLKKPVVFKVLAILILAYFALFGYSLFSSVARQDFGTMRRFLTPIFPFLMLLACAMLALLETESVETASMSRITCRSRWAIIIVAALVLVGCLKIDWSCYPTTAREGFQYTSLPWRSSKLIAFVKSLDAGRTVVSNRQEPLWFYTRRNVEALPQFWDCDTDQNVDTNQYSKNLAEIAERLLSSGGCTIVFTNAYLGKSELQNSLIDRAMRHAQKRIMRDGVVYDFRP